MLISDWRSDVCSSDLACDFTPDEFGRDIIRDGSAPVLPVAGIFFQAFTPQILSLCDILHFRRDDAALRIMHLADVHAGLGAKWALDDLWEGRDSGRTVRTFQAIIFRLYSAGVIFLDVAARHDPIAAKLRSAE